MTTATEIKSLAVLVPPEALSKTFVIAGAAVDFNLDGDIDIMVLTGASCQEEFVGAVVELQQYLDMLSEDCNLTVDSSGVNPQYEASSRCLVASVLMTGISKNIHILASKHNSIEQAISEFDTSVHAIALGFDGVLHRVPLTTSPSDPIKILRDNTPISTLKRYLRLCARYKQTPDFNEVERMVKAYSARATKGTADKYV
jgi:hypothetical protein